MSGCPALGIDGPGGVAEALRSVDCMSGEATAIAFGRLFGGHAMLGTALTLMLTLHVALLAINLLTGRSRLSLSMLTPRMMGLGLALTFATSWLAYQSVVWNLATGAPDQIASLIVGTKGSATALFADRLDGLFAAIATAAGAAQAASEPAKAAASFTPADLLWIAALMLLLGTVGVLIVARIALAALLALGPVFIVLALFAGTRGLFEGWLKAMVLFALVPLLTVLIGGGALVMLAPAIAGLAMGGEPTMRAAVTIFLGAAVYLMLMAMVLKVAVTLTAGWRLGRQVAPRGDERPVAEIRTTAQGDRYFEMTAPQGGSARPAADRARVDAIVAGLGVPANDRAPHLRGVSPAPLGLVVPPALPPASDRLRGIGRPVPPSKEKMP